MSVIIWATLLYAVRSSGATTVAPARETPEITAEAGLCVVIPCNSSDPDFPLESAVWYKCEDSCPDSDKILNNTSPNAQSWFDGRVSLLEPDVNQRNCSSSIIINDLSESDSGLYLLLIPNRTMAEFTHHRITVKGLIQKPTVMIPPLTEGQQTTLTCTVPGLCSGSPPEITWTWTGAGEKDSHITGNITAFKTENLTAVTQRHSSTLTFNASAEHHGINVTCKVSFSNNITTEETVTLNVTYVKKFEITGERAVKKGDTLNLTCSVDSYPPSVVTWTKLNLNKRLNDEPRSDLQNSAGMAVLFIRNMTAEHSGQYICRAKHLDNLVKEVNITVMYVGESKITGNRTVKEGDTLNLTCSVESSPPPHVTWTQVPSNKHLHKGTETDPQNNTGTASLVIPNMTAEDTGQYICTAKHLDMTVTVYANVTVIVYPKILKSSGCINQLEVLTCTCISQGFPLPTIKWPLLENHNEYSVINTVSKHTVNSTVILTVKNPSNSVAECVSSSGNGEVKQDLIINKAEHEEEGRVKKLLSRIARLEILIAFLIGALLSAVICCLVRKCHRKKQKTYGDVAETLEMVTSQENPLKDAGQAEEDEQVIEEEAAEAGGAVVAGKSDVEYSDLDFSLSQRPSPAEAGTTQGTPETEYAEIKKEKVQERQDGEGEEEEKMIGEDEETKCFVPDEEEGEDVALYATVKDVMDEI